MNILYGSGNLLVSSQAVHGHGSATQIAGFISTLRKRGHSVVIDASTFNKEYSKIRGKIWLQWIKQKFPPSWLFYEMLQISNNRKILQRFYIFELQEYDILWQRYELFTSAYSELAREAHLPNVLFVDAPLILERKRYGHLWLESRAVEVLRRNVALADLVVTISDPVRDYIRKYIKTKPSEIYVMPNGFSEHILDVDEEEVITLRKEIFGDFSGTIIGFAGYIKRWQSLDYLLKVVSNLFQSRDDFRVLILGEGPELETQKQLANDLGISDRVKFMGNIPFFKIAPYINLFDIGIMANSNLYGSPMKIAEYMACGAVVVAPKLKPIEALCADGKEGILFEKDDLSSLQDALVTLLDNVELRKQMGQNAKTRAIEEHSWNARIKDLEPLLEKIVL
jgi:glycosyltransferase involved in cell wall biosynthesis